MQEQALVENFDEFWKLDPATGCWNWQRGTNGRGYGKLWNGQRHIRAHRFSYERAFGPIGIGEIVRHQCDNPRCVNPAHLLLGLPAHNSHDMVSRGRQARGERLSHLSLGDIFRIRDVWCIGDHTQKEMAAYFQVSQAAISKIVLRQTWGHV